MGLKDPTTALTVERVLRSNGSLTMADMSAGIDLGCQIIILQPTRVVNLPTAGMAMGFYHHKEALDGFYCIYRKRANESTGGFFYFSIYVPVHTLAAIVCHGVLTRTIWRIR